MRYIVFILLSCLVNYIPSSFAVDLHVVTENSYPIQYRDRSNGKIIGPTTELIKDILAAAHLSYDIKMYPWARAYEMALNKPNVLIFSIARTKLRESKFKWIGSLMKLNYALYGLNTFPTPNKISLMALNQYRIGVVRASALHQYLKAYGITNFYLVSNGEQNINKLLSNRVDLITANSTSFQLSCLHMQVDCSKTKIVYPLEEPSTELYFAVSNTTDDAIVNKLKQAYNQVMHKNNNNISHYLAKP